MTAHLRHVSRARPAPVVLVPVLTALALVAVCTPALDGGAGLLVLRGAALLLAVAVAAVADEPLARLLDASPTSWARRVAVRAVPVLAVVGLAWTVVLGWASVHGDPPALALTYQLCVLAALGTALALALRRWSGRAEPAVVAGPLLAGLLLLSSSLPRRFSLLPGQAWGPPWEAAHLRWGGLLLAAVAALALGLADPATAGRRQTARPSRASAGISSRSS